jgi:hypothetical protein
MRTPPKNVFISYAHQDREFVDELVTHLAGFHKKKYIKTFCDYMIDPGSDWRNMILESLKEADIVLLLLSSDFLASLECWKEMKIALSRRHKATVISIVIRHVDLDDDLLLTRRQMLPFGREPVANGSRADRDEAWSHITNYITEVAKREAQKAPTGSNPRRTRRASGKSPSRPDRYNSKVCLRTFGSVSHEIKIALQSADHVSLLSRTGQGWWVDFGLHLNRLLKADKGEKNRLVFLNPKCRAFDAVKHLWLPGAWKPGSSFQHYKSDASAFHEQLRGKAKLKFIDRLFPLSILIVHPREDLSGEPTMFVEFPAFSESYQSKPFIRVTAKDHEYFRSFHEVFNQFWENGREVR